MILPLIKPPNILSAYFTSSVISCAQRGRTMLCSTSLPCCTNRLRLASIYTATMMPMIRFLATVTTFSTPMAAPLTMFCMEGSRVFLSHVFHVSRLVFRAA